MGSGFWFLAFGCWHWVLGQWFWAFGCRHSVLGSKGEVPKFRGGLKALGNKVIEVPERDRACLNDGFGVKNRGIGSPERCSWLPEVVFGYPDRQRG